MFTTFVKWWLLVVGDIVIQSTVNAWCMHVFSDSQNTFSLRNWEEQVDPLSLRYRISLAAFALHSRIVGNRYIVQESSPILPGLLSETCLTLYFLVKRMSSSTDGKAGRDSRIQYVGLQRYSHSEFSLIPLPTMGDASSIGDTPTALPV